MGVHHPENLDERLEDKIADLVIAKFNALPRKNKPAVDNNGNHNWVPLSGIVISDANPNSNDDDIECVSLATGMKCLPSNKIPLAQGFVLHDWHAEILSIRGFNHFLIEECQRLSITPKRYSRYIRWRDEDEKAGVRGLQPFTIRESVRIHMYCSEAPCGDASMELTMINQQDATPWAVETSLKDRGDQSTPLKGRGSFSELGIVRRKPSRPDSPPTLSKSCSDKLALKQCTSLLSSPTSLLLSPENAYLHGLILPSSQYVASACDRAFSDGGRLSPVAKKQWHGEYALHPFYVGTTSRDFMFSRRSLSPRGQIPKSSNISALWTPSLQQTLIKGVLQGRKETDPKGGSAVCRLRTWGAVLNVLKILAIPAYNCAMASSRYTDLKGAQVLEDRRIVKEEVRTQALKGWIQNAGDDFELNPE